MLWMLRYREPMCVRSVAIETKTDDAVEAEALGRWYVNQQGGPGHRFIAVERWIVARTVDMPAATQDEKLAHGVTAGKPTRETVAGRVGA